MDYAFIMIFLGSLIFVGLFARVPGGGLLASVFALGLFGVSKETAAAMTGIVMGSFVVSVVVIGGAALLWHGVDLTDLRSPRLSSKQDMSNRESRNEGSDGRLALVSTLLAC